MSNRRTVRNEWKYEISPKSAILLDARLSAFLKRDKHGGRDGYLIRSLYFDDIYESAFYEKTAGVKERVKYRIRYYDFHTDVIFFERKRKHGIYIEKDSVLINRNIAENMIQNRPLKNAVLQDSLLAEYSALRSSSLLKPRVIVDYQRKAYTFQEQNVRITLDSNIQSGMYRTDAFFEKPMMLPVSNHDNVVLEVKFDRYLPDWPKEALSQLQLTSQANSKFCMSVLPMI